VFEQFGGVLFVTFFTFKIPISR